MKWRRIEGLLLKCWWITTQRVDRMFDIFYWQAPDIFIWGLFSNYFASESSFDPLKVILGGIILWLFLWRNAQDVSVYVLEEYWSKNLYHLFSSPVTIGEFILSLMIVALGRTIVSALFLVFIAYLLYSFSFFTLPLIWLGYFMACLILAGWFVGMMISSLILRYGGRIQALAWAVVWIIQPFSCVFYPLSSLPGWAYAIARWNPLTYVFEGMRAVINAEQLSGRAVLYPGLASVLLFVVGCLVLGLIFKKARKAGYLAKPE